MEIHPLRAIFADRVREREYRQQEISSHVFQTTIVMVVVMAVMAAFARSDYLFFGFSKVFLLLLAMRVGYVVVSALLLWVLWKYKDSRLLTPWASATFIAVLLINLSRPSDYSYNFAADLLYLLLFFAYVPVSLISKTVVAAAFTVGEILMLFLMRDAIGEKEQSVLLFSLLMIDLIGFTLARSNELVRRRRFLAVLREAEAKQKLAEHAEELERSNQALDSFSRTVAHDLKNPLGGIIGIVDLLKDELRKEPPDREQLEDFIRLLDDSAEHLTAIVDSLLLLARLRRGDTSEVTAVDLSASIERVLKRLKREREQSCAAVDVSTPLPDVLGYAPWVDEVLANFIGNAIKYGGKPPRIVIDAVTAENDYVRIQVQDNGHGVDDAQKTRIFDEFTRGEHRRVDGLGLGLSIAKRVVERLGGEIGVTDAEEGGSIFWLTLPAVAMREMSPAVDVRPAAL